MKKITMMVLAVLMAVTMSGCSMFSNNKEENASDKVKDEIKKDAEDMNEDVKDGIDDLMNFMKGEGVNYNDNKTIEKFDWPAKEGTSFMYNNENVYLYRVDPSDAKVAGLLSNVQKNNMVNASQNGEEKRFGASVNGDYLLVYGENADIKELVEVFKKYEAKKYGDTTQKDNYDNKK